MMKINEKNLCAFAVSSTYAADKEGFLMKKGEVNKGFQKRWFVLKGNLLFYFDKRFDKEPLGVIILEGCTIELDEADAQFSFKIVFHGMGNRSYVLCADNQETMEQWMKSLACSSYDYMKLMVTDLQRQLKETKCNKVADKMTEYADMSSVDCISSLPPNASNEETGYANVPQHSTSPHPPPRQRHLNHRSQGQFQVCSSLSNLPRSKTNQISSTNNLPNSRNKISFRDLHTQFGRPVLRDRNEWRYNKKAEENANSIPPSLIDSDFQIHRQENFLISL